MPIIIIMQLHVLIPCHQVAQPCTLASWAVGILLLALSRALFV